MSAHQTNGAMARWRDLLARQEPLHPELERYHARAGEFDAVRHPLVYDIPYFPAMNAMLNERLRVLQAAVNAAMRAGKWGEYIMLHQRPYRPQALAFARECIDSAAAYWPLVGDVWSDTENFWQERALWRSLLTTPKGWLVERVLMMDDDERAAYGRLPGRLTVYRGGSNKYLSAAKTGFSWTTDIKVARRFASRFEHDGQGGSVFEREVFKRDIIAVFNGRNEAEVLLDPSVVVPGRNACRLAERVAP